MPASKRKLLIVDDEVDIRESIEEIVKDRLGVTCETAENGKVALEKVKTFEPHAVISDIRMPEMGGLELLAAIRNLGIDVPFILLTAYADRPYTVEALRLGATDFIEKPMEESLIVQAIDRALDLGVSLKGVEAELDEFCKSLAVEDKSKVEAYRQAKRASLILKAQNSKVLSKRNNV